MTGAAARQRVLILAYYYPPGEASGGVRPWRFAKYLPEFGWDCAVVTGGTGEAAGAVRYVPGSGKTGLSVRLASVVARWMQRLLPYNEQLLFVPGAVQAARDLLAQTPVTAVLSTFPPVATHLVAWYLKRCHGLRWVADFRDPLADNPFRDRRTLFSYDRALEAAVFRHADAIIVNTEPMRTIWNDRYPHCRGKIFLIPNGYDPGERLEAAPIPTRDFQVLAHVGNFYGGRHPGGFLSALYRLIQAGHWEPARLRIQLVGSLEASSIARSQPAFDALCRSGCLEFTGGSVSREQAQRCLAEADKLVLVDIHDGGSSVQVPAKLFEYMQVGRPILAWTRAGSPASSILERGGVPHRCVYTSDPATEADRKVREILTLPNDATTPNDWFLDTFNVRRQVEKLGTILRPVTDHNPLIR